MKIGQRKEKIMGNRGQSSGKSGGGAGGGARKSAASMMKQADELSEQIEERIDQYRGPRGSIDIDAAEQDAELTAMRGQLADLDRQTVDVMARSGISDNVLPRGLKGDPLNQDIEWDKGKIESKAKDIAAERLAIDGRRGDPDAIWQSAQDEAVRRAKAHPKEYATNYNPHTFGVGDKMKPNWMSATPEAEADFMNRQTIVQERKGGSAKIKIGDIQLNAKIETDMNGDEVMKIGGSAWSAIYYANPAKR